jgi:F-type H+-transporting ATPase subunit a
MEQIEHKLLIVQWVNALLGGLIEPLKAALGHPTPAGADVIPDYMVMCSLVLTGLIVLGLIVRSIILEDLVSAVAGLLDEWIGPKGRQFLPLIGALGAFILVGNYLGLIPGFMSPTSNINVTVGCAIRRAGPDAAADAGH